MQGDLGHVKLCAGQCVLTMLFLALFKANQPMHMCLQDIRSLCFARHAQDDGMWESHAV